MINESHLVATHKRAPKVRGLVCAHKQSWRLKWTRPGTAWHWRVKRPQWSFQCQANPVHHRPAGLSSRGMVSLMRDFLDTQQAREERYLRELWESIQQSVPIKKARLPASSSRLWYCQSSQYRLQIQPWWTAQSLRLWPTPSPRYPGPIKNTDCFLFPICTLVYFWTSPTESQRSPTGTPL